MNSVTDQIKLAFAAVVTGLTGEYLHETRGQSTWSRKRFIYTIVVSSLSIFLSLLWLLPFSGAFIHWPVDIIFFGLWIAAFGLLVNVSAGIPNIIPASLTWGIVHRPS